MSASTPLEAAQAELAAIMVPWPDDWVEDLSAPAALLFLRQMAMATLKVVAVGTVELGADTAGEEPVLDGVLNGCAAAIMGATHALVSLGVLPAEAETAEQAAYGG